MNEKTIQELAATENAVWEVINAFSETEFNAVPFEGSWTPGQVAEHVRKSLKGMRKLLSGPAENTMRNPNEKTQALCKMFLNFDLKMQSPEMIIPADKSYDKQAMAAALRDELTSIIELAKTQDLAETCLHFELPVFGALTRLELCHFIVVHTQRHIYQLKRILSAVHPV